MSVQLCIEIYKTRDGDNSLQNNWYCMEPRQGKEPTKGRRDLMEGCEREMMCIDMLGGWGGGAGHSYREHCHLFQTFLCVCVFI